MGVRLDMSGFDDLRKRLANINGEHEMPLRELLPDQFIKEYTRFETLEAMLTAAHVQHPEDVKSEAFSQFITANSRFATWRDMEQLALHGWMKRQIAGGN